MAVGDEVTVRAQRDDRPRELIIPADLAQALAGDDAARAVFDGLSLRHRREYAEWVASAKRDETRARRGAGTLDRLRR